MLSCGVLLNGRAEHANPSPCRTFTELWDDDGETEQGRNELINKVYNFVDIPTVTVGDEAEMPLISFGTGPAVENETRWEIKQAIQAGHRSAQATAANDVPHTLVAVLRGMSGVRSELGVFQAIHR